MRKTPITTYIIAALAVIFVSLGAFLFVVQKHSFEVKGTANDAQNKDALQVNVGPISPITGENCANNQNRLIGVMMSGDAITRPLSGLGQADLVVEMPVITDSITRYLAFFQCEQPAEIGSVRSVRDDFIPLALGLDAIFSHWGGSHFALDELKSGIINNINALNDKYKAYFRKDGIAEPHNGFTSYTNLKNSAQKLDYRPTTQLAAYPHEPVVAKTDAARATLNIPYPGDFKAAWQYEPSTNTYKRLKGGTPEIDKNTGQQVMAKVVVVLKTDIHQIEGQYNDVRVTGKGDGVIYQDGKVLPMTWRKDTDKSKLTFLDQSGTEILLQPGKIWLQYIQTTASVTYDAAKP